ncbi:unnamed protein product [Penicillium camemberti]|uniref:Str. FM013 n=1 Tax=Penicillium camemberti (strain FM 013) TaxID=1429867 RepID=A0A0G4PBI4_PENC3|nr:unnamed protein product [Penicillium camemberti]
MSDQMAPKYIVTFRDSAATEEINSYVHQIQAEGGLVTNRFPDMIARGFSKRRQPGPQFKFEPRGTFEPWERLSHNLGGPSS